LTDQKILFTIILQQYNINGHYQIKISERGKRHEKTKEGEQERKKDL